jgi:hypothetical protein
MAPVTFCHTAGCITSSICRECLFIYILYHHTHENQELQRILSRCLDFLYSGTNTPSGLQVDCDYLLIIRTIETQLFTWQRDWQAYRQKPNGGCYVSTCKFYSHPSKFEGESAPAVAYKALIARFYFNYAMLIINSFGLQNALERSPVDIGHFFARCHSSAMACAKLVRDELGPSGFMKYSPDSHFVQTSYAVLSILKVRD